MPLFRNRQQRAHDEAGEWLVRIRAGPTEAEQRRFEAWYDKHPSHRAAYDDQARYWDVAPQLGHAFPGAAETAQRAPRSVSRQRFAAAAAVVAGLGLGRGTFIVASERRDPTAPDAPEMLLIATSIGEIREVSLDQGARVILDTDSALRVSAGSSRRELELQRGRARIEVEPGTGRVLVQARAAWIEAEGAVFDVRIDEEAAIITTIDGAVLVRTGRTPPAAATRLVEQQSLAVAPGEARLSRAPDRSTGWPSGMLEFDQARLGDVVAEANRYSRRKLRLADPDLASLKVSGAFRSGDIEGLARSLASAFGLDLDALRGNDLMLRAGRPQK